MMVFLKGFFEKGDLKKNQWTAKTHENFSRMQIVKDPPTSAVDDILIIRVNLDTFSFCSQLKC